MRMVGYMAALLLLPAMLVPGETEACSSFLLANGKRKLMGKSYDWHTGDGLLIENKRGVKKQAFLPFRRHIKPLRWVSRYGSVSFNQYGRELPLGGLNEKGLAIEVLWLNQTRHAEPKASRPGINELQWIQYLLDTAASTQEALRQLRGVQIAKAYANVHYIMCDKSGACATVEHLNGKQVIHHGKGLPVAALTNNPYAQSYQTLQRHKGFGGKRSIPGHSGSLARYCRVASLARRSSKRPTVHAAFQILDRVRMGSYSKWQIVYDLTQGHVHFRNAGTKKYLTVDLSKRDFSCRKPVQVMDLQGTVIKQQKPHWKRYTTAINQALIQRTFRRLGAQFPPLLLRGLARLPARMTRCTR